MATPTYSVSALVLKRTKLGESDLIITLLASDGSQIRAIAKGARKPTSPFAVRLELFSCVRLLLAQGKNLDIVKESRIIESFSFLRENISFFEAAAPIVEFLEKTTMENLEVPRLFDLTEKTLSSFKETDESETLKFSAAFLLKALAFMGFKPKFESCMLCGSPVFNSNLDESLAFSSNEGGSICSNCLINSSAVFYRQEIIQYAHYLLYSTLDSIKGCNDLNNCSVEVLRLINELLVVHMGVSLKSLRFLFAHPF